MDGPVDLVVVYYCFDIFSSFLNLEELRPFCHFSYLLYWLQQQSSQALFLILWQEQLRSFNFWTSWLSKSSTFNIQLILCLWFIHYLPALDITNKKKIKGSFSHFYQVREGHMLCSPLCTLSYLPDAVKKGPESIEITQNLSC